MSTETNVERVVAENRASVESALKGYVAGRRWFRSKSRPIDRVTVAELFPLASGASIARLGVKYLDGGEDSYVLPLVFASGPTGPKAVASLPNGSLYDAAEDVTVLAELLPLFAANTEIAARSGKGTTRLRFRTTPAFVQMGGASAGAEPRLLGAEQTNTSVALGDRFLLKIVRKLDEGASPDLEMGERLTKAGYANSPLVAGAIDLAAAGKEPATVGILSLFVKSQGDAWGAILAELARWLPLENNALLPEGRTASSPEGEAFIGPWLTLAKRLGTRTGEMHLSLVKGEDLDNFRADAADADSQNAFAANVEKDITRSFAQLDARLRSLPDSVKGQAERLREKRASLSAIARDFAALPPSGARIRVHGDYHLGQVLFTGDDFVIIDFEGEPARPLAERKGKRSPLADVAGMLRSFHYASVAAARAAREKVSASKAMILDARALAWHRWITESFLEGYFDATKDATFLPAPGRQRSLALAAHLLEKALYELRYELDNRPDWAALPIAGLIDVASQETRP